MTDKKEFKIVEPSNPNIIVDPETGFKSIRLDADGCPPGFSWNTTLGRCTPIKENTIDLNRSKPKDLVLESKPRSGRPIRRDNNQDVQSS